MYVYNDGAIVNDHPIRRSVYTAFGWLLIHLPLSVALVVLMVVHIFVTLKYW